MRRREDSYQHAEKKKKNRIKHPSEGVVEGPHIVCDTGDDAGCWSYVKPATIKLRVITGSGRRSGAPQGSADNGVYEILMDHLGCSQLSEYEIEKHAGASQERYENDSHCCSLVDITWVRRLMPTKEGQITERRLVGECSREEHTY